jgi:protein gp37
MSAIQWTDETWNPVVGCTRVSEGCRYCYAEVAANRMRNRVPVYDGLTQITNGRPQWTGTVRCLPERLDEPLRWRTPRRVFVNSMSDLFHWNVTERFLRRVWLTMACARQHQFQVLTKRPQRMRDWLRGPGEGDVRASYEAAPVDLPPWEWPLPNVWLGVSCENQAAADARIPSLLQCPAAVRFVSLEPLLGPIDLQRLGAREPEQPCRDCWFIAQQRQWQYRDLTEAYHAVTQERERAHAPCTRPNLNWVIVGGESGTNARACDVRWIENIVDQCRAARVPCFVKQLGARPFDAITGEFFLLRNRQGGDPEEWPVDLRVREWPVALRVREWPKERL